MAATSNEVKTEVVTQEAGTNNTLGATSLTTTPLTSKMGKFDPTKTEMENLQTILSLDFLSEVDADRKKYAAQYAEELATQQAFTVVKD